MNWDDVAPTSLDEPVADLGIQLSVLQAAEHRYCTC